MAIPKALRPVVVAVVAVTLVLGFQLFSRLQVEQAANRRLHARAVALQTDLEEIRALAHRLQTERSECQELVRGLIEELRKFYAFIAYSDYYWNELRECGFTPQETRTWFHQLEIADREIREFVDKYLAAYPPSRELTIPHPGALALPVMGGLASRVEMLRSEERQSLASCAPEPWWIAACGRGNRGAYRPDSQRQPNP